MITWRFDAKDILNDRFKQSNMQIESITRVTTNYTVALRCCSSSNIRNTSSDQISKLTGQFDFLIVEDFVTKVFSKYVNNYNMSGLSAQAKMLENDISRPSGPIVRKYGRSFITVLSVIRRLYLSNYDPSYIFLLRNRSSDLRAVDSIKFPALKRIFLPSERLEIKGIAIVLILAQPDC